MPNYAQDTLVEGEKVVYHGHIHPITAIKAPLYVLCLPVLFAAFEKITGNHSGPVSGAAVIAFAIGLAIAAAIGYITVVSSEFTVTTHRAVFKTGVLARKTLEMLLERVESTSVAQSIPGRIFDYGQLVITGTGGSKETFASIANPLNLRRALMQQLEIRAETNRSDKTTHDQAR